MLIDDLCLCHTIIALNLTPEHHQQHLYPSSRTIISLSLSLCPSLFHFYTLTQNQVSTKRMVTPTQSWRPQKPTIVLLLLCISLESSVEEAITSSKKLDTDMKCGSCPCGNTCSEQLPPPPPPPCSPPPSSPPPPPPLPPPSPSPPPPPPPPKYPSCPENCNPLLPLSPPPPPPPRFIYVPVPGQPKPYTWVFYYSGAEKRVVGLLVLAALGALSMATEN
ncbi:uncharacterized protein LOC133312968 [Gastrolobium bilobum]|uniref:uncharacterized protein LOC133312968 n=1 Tax=Gastrolobium bilobum TaxID=150636 RepID=UPI002AB04633|nr:uncharacterized protein LOC133312968 [Gastrolobium bilobum]